MGNSWLALLPSRGECSRARHAGVGYRHRRAPEVRGGSGRPHQRRRSPTSAHDRDNSAGARRARLLLTDGPYIEGAEVANGFYIIDADDRAEAVKIASMIP